MTDQMRKRIAELEEALKYFLDRSWFNLVSDTLPDNHVVSMDARIGDLRRAALLLSEQKETPERTPEQKAAFDELLRMDGELYDVPVKETGDVERVTLADCPIGLFLSDAGELCLKTEYGSNDGRIDAFIVSSGEYFWGAPPQTIESQRKQIVSPVSAAALAAMRPVSVDVQKLVEIRARHDAVADMADDEWDNRIYTIADDAFSDRAFLLSVIEGAKNDAD